MKERRGTKTRETALKYIFFASRMYLFETCKRLNCDDGSRMYFSSFLGDNGGKN